MVDVASCLLVLFGRLSVDVGEHEADVAGEEVVHLLPKPGLADEPGPTGLVAQHHAEVVRAARPVGDPGERVGHQNILKQV